MTTVQERRESEQPRRPIDLPRYEPGRPAQPPPGRPDRPATRALRVLPLADVTADSVSGRLTAGPGEGPPHDPPCRVGVSCGSRATSGRRPSASR